MKTAYPENPHRTIQIHYIQVLSQLENYLLPTNNRLRVSDFYADKIYTWYAREQKPYYRNTEDPAWYLNYE